MSEKARTLIIESVLIVVSILVAFAIDAWWDERQARSEEHRVLQSLAEEFRTNAERLPVYQNGLALSAEASDELFEKMRAAGPGNSIQMSALQVGRVVVHSSSDPQLSALNAILQSGELRFISNPTIRRRLANWPRAVADSVENEVMLREIWDPRLMDVLSHAADLTPLGALMGECWVSGAAENCPPEMVTISYDQRVMAVLTMTKGYAEEGARELGELAAHAAEIAELIEQELAARPSN